MGNKRKHNFEEKELSSAKGVNKQKTSPKENAIDSITPDSTTAATDNASTSQDYQDGNREVAGLKDMALNDDIEDQGSDDSDCDEENVADQSFPDDLDNDNDETNQLNESLFVVDPLGTGTTEHAQSPAESNTEIKEEMVEDGGQEQIIPPNINNTRYNYTLLPQNRALIQIYVNDHFCFRGSLKVRVLRGVISCQGYHMKPSTQFTNVYSPKFYSSMSFKGVQSGEDESKMLDDFLKSACIRHQPNILPNCAVAIIEMHSEPWIDYLKKGLKSLGGKPLSEDKGFCNLGKQIDINVIGTDDFQNQIWTEGQDWEIVLNSMEITQKNGQQPKLICMGGKGVGKSTFLRWCQNQNLNAGNKCLYLDLDPGQREFGLPCYLSLCLVNKPVLGHSVCQPEPEWTFDVFFGDISVGSQPERYLKCVDLLLKEAKNYKEYPLLVNTMGWVQGLGLQVNTEIIKRLKPTTVVQIQSRNSKSNAPCSFTPNWAMNRRTTWTRKSVELSYALIEIDVAEEVFTSESLKNPLQLREIKLLAWMGRFKPLKEMPVYSISYSSVALHVIHERVPNQGLLAALAGRFVDLCHVPENEIIRCKQMEEYYSILKTSPLVRSLGVGLIRSVDAQKKMIYLTSYIPEEQLEQVNCLVGGKLEVPTVILKREQKGPHMSQAAIMEHPLEKDWTYKNYLF